MRTDVEGRVQTLRQDLRARTPASSPRSCGLAAAASRELTFACVFTRLARTRDASVEQLPVPAIGVPVEHD